MRTIGIICDNYKTEIFREHLIAQKYSIKYDGKGPTKVTHLFTIEVEDNMFEIVKEEVDKFVRKHLKK